MRDEVIIQARGQQGNGVDRDSSFAMSIPKYEYLLQNAFLKIKAIQFTLDIRLRTHLVHF